MAVIVPILSTFNDKGIKSAVRQFQTAKTSIQKFGAVGKIFEGVGKSLTKNLTVPLIAAGGGLAVLAKSAEQAEIANRKLDAVLTSMGFPQATQRVSNYAEELERTLAIDADIIKATQTKLATFKNLTATINESGGAFDRATLAALDLAAAGFGEAETNAVQLGKALQDPIKGITALARSGVTFTQQEKDKIRTLVESNRMLDAQNIILSAIEKQVGGTALAGASSFERIRLSLMQLGDEIGMAVLPLIQQFADYISNEFIPNVIPKIKNFVNSWNELSPTFKKVIAGVLIFLAGIGPLFLVMGKIVGAIYSVISALIAYRTSLLVTNTAMAATAVSAKAMQAALISTGIGALVVLLGVLAAKFIYSYQTSEKFRDKVKGALNVVIDGLENFVNNAVSYLNTFVEYLNKIIDKMQEVGISVENIGAIAEVSFKRFSTSGKVIYQDTSKMSYFTKQLAGITSTKLSPAMEEFGDTSDKASEKAEKLRRVIQAIRDAAVKAAQVVVDDLNESLRTAQDGLDQARNKFDDFKNAITGTITGILNFGQAAESENFLQGLTEQAANATDFANKVKQLIQLGLSERGIQEVLNAGFDAGSRIADELIAGGATVVQQVNTLLSSVQSVAEIVGDQGAKQFFQAGLDQGTALVNGILEALRQAQSQLAAAQKAALSGSAIGDFTNLGARATGLLSQIEGIKNERQRNAALADFASALEKSKGAPAISKTELSGITKKYKLAKGGIVLGPTNALIGEAGPEAVVPLSGANSAGLGSTINITVNAGIGTDGAAVGRQVVDAIRKYERISGPVFAKA